jgi:hypothetical protein
VGRRIAVWSLILSFYLAPLPAAAQLAPGEIVVTVTDAATKAPIADAAVFLLGGDIPESSLTDAQGRLTFQDRQPGSYALEVKKDGYDTYDLADVEVGPDQHVAVAIALKNSTALKTIATVVAKASSSISSTEIGANSAERKVSMSLKNALSKIAGVTIDDSTYGPNSAFGISLLNHDESQTSYAVNGIRISGPGGGDLGSSFTGASVNFTPTAGTLQGTVNYYTVHPTKYWTYDVSETAGDFGAATEAATVTGTTGRLGLAYQYGFTRRDSNLSGLTFRDQSGPAYLHEAASTALSNVLIANYALSPKVSLRFQGVAQLSRPSAICADFTTILPCGYGPNRRTTSSDSYPSIGFSALVGNVQMYGTVARSSFHSESSDLRSFAGALIPYSSTFGGSGTNVQFQANVAAKRHRIALYSYTSTFASSSSTTYDGVPTAFPDYRTTDVSDFLYVTVEASPRLALTHALTYENTTGSSSVGASESIEWKPTTADSLQAGVSVGGAQPSFASNQFVGDALSADYDCYNHSIFTSGPQDAPTRQSQVGYNMTWLHNFHGAGGSLKLQLLQSEGRGQYMSASVPIAAEPASLFPGGLDAYLASLKAVWSSAGICGSIPFATDRIYVKDGVTGLSQASKSVLLSGRIPLGRNVFALPAYTLASVYLTALDPRLAAPDSFYSVGTQLPHRPLRTASLTFSGILTHAHLEWFANGLFTDANNGANLPAFTNYSAGLVFQSKHGAMTLVESNVFGTYAGLFSTYRGVYPMPVVGGGTFAFATTPAQPRQWTFTWDVPWTQRIPPPPPKPSPKPSAVPKPSPSPSPTPKP